MKTLAALILLLLALLMPAARASRPTARAALAADSLDTLPRAERHRIMPIPVRNHQRTDTLIAPVDIANPLPEDTLKPDTLTGSIPATAPADTTSQPSTVNSQQPAVTDTLSQNSKPKTQNSADTVPFLRPDEVAAWADSVEQAIKEIPIATIVDTTDVRPPVTVPLPSQQSTVNSQRSFTPDPQRALWLGLVFPGAGQIYNHKYWKLPIFYGGFLGCAYALTWNNQMLRDYSQAYLDIMDDDPNTQSYLKMLPMGYDITGREDRFKEIFKNKKNYYRKYRDMSIFAFIAVYGLAVIDAYVDAELSTFDISRDLTLHLEPAQLRGSGTLERRYGNTAVGLACQLKY